MQSAAWLFPGQGSQFVAMGRDLYAQDLATRELFALASATTGLDLTTLCFEGPAATLQQTQFAQPALLTVSVAFVRYLQHRGARADWVLGHSLGEYSALVASGVLNFSDAIRIVQRRGALMAKAADGAMAAVLGLPEDIVCDLCNDAGGGVWPANFNAPRQVVISGTLQAIQKVADLVKERGGGRLVPLRVGGAFHSPLMRTAAEGLRQTLSSASFYDAEIPVISTVDGQVHRCGEDFRELLEVQVIAPVLWTRSITTLLELTHGPLLEVGPGSVLAGLVRQHDPGATVTSVGTVKAAKELPL